MAHAKHHQAASIREVWADTLDKEVGMLLMALRDAGPRPLVAMDTEFPGFVRSVSSFAPINAQYHALRTNVDLLKPIQLGLSVASAEGSILGTWNFNLHFNEQEDFHSEASMEMLRGAGIDFARHATSGIEWNLLGRRLGASPYLRRRSKDITLVTFAGLYDLGYMFKIFTGKPLPADFASFEGALGSLCAHRRELRDWCPFGSLEYIAASRAVQRMGVAHTAASDALLTLQIFLGCITDEAATRIEVAPVAKLPSIHVRDTRSSWGAAARAAMVSC